MTTDCLVPVDDDILVTASGRSGRRVPSMRVFGVDEADIWALAPVRQCDRLHWATAEEFDVGLLMQHLPVTWVTRRWSDGQHRVWVPAGEGPAARELLREHCRALGSEPLNLRVEPAVPFRDIDAIPADLFQGLMLATVDWLFPRVYSVRRKIVADNELLSDEDVRSMMYLFVADHADRYDAGRVGRNGTLNFASFMLGKIRTWPQDAARAMHGRTVLDDRLQLHQAVESALASNHRLPTEHELADILHTGVEDVRRRRLAVAEYSGMRFHDTVVTGGAYSPGEGVDVADDADFEDQVSKYAADAMLTRSILAAVHSPVSGRGKSAPDAMGLAAVYLTYWGEMSRQDVAELLGVLPKSVTTATQRVLAQAGSVPLDADADPA